MSMHPIMQVERAGIRGLSADGDAAASDTAPPPEMDDPRRTKRQLNADLATAAAHESFLNNMSEVMAADELLRRCLLPISVTVQVSC